MSDERGRGATRAPQVPGVSFVTGWLKFGFVVAVLGVIFGMWTMTAAGAFLADVLGFLWAFITGAIDLIKTIAADCKSGNGCG
jgi:hypothetical protein